MNEHVHPNFREILGGMMVNITAESHWSNRPWVLVEDDPDYPGLNILTDENEVIVSIRYQGEINQELRKLGEYIIRMHNDKLRAKRGEVDVKNPRW